jgi:aspartate aminotransferase
MNSPFDYRLAPRMNAVRPSSFAAVLRLAREKEARGEPVLDLSIGEPDFETPAEIKEAGIRAIRTNNTRYTASDGTAALKRAIMDKFSRDNSLQYRPDEILVTNGGVQGIFNTFQATIGPGDEVILPAPYFTPYLSSIKLAGGTPIVLETREEEGFVPQPEAIAAVLSQRTRWLVLNSPTNPSGAVFTREQLSAIADVLRPHPRVLVLSDDIYETIRFTEGPYVNIINADPSFKDRTVILNGVSKAYAMTGWRLAYLAGPSELIGGIAQVSFSSAFTPNSISQAAAQQAISGPQTSTRVQSESYKARMVILAELMKDIPKLTFHRSQGTFFLLVNCRAFIGLRRVDGELVRDDVDFVLHALSTQSIAFMPGSTFGAPGYFRISFAASEAVIREAVSRLKAFCSELS